MKGFRLEFTNFGIQNKIKFIIEFESCDYIIENVDFGFGFIGIANNLRDLKKDNDFKGFCYNNKVKLSDEDYDNLWFFMKKYTDDKLYGPPSFKIKA